MEKIFSLSFQSVPFASAIESKLDVRTALEHTVDFGKCKYKNLAITPSSLVKVISFVDVH